MHKRKQVRPSVASARQGKAKKKDMNTPSFPSVGRLTSEHQKQTPLETINHSLKLNSLRCTRFALSKPQKRIKQKWKETTWNRNQQRNQHFSEWISKLNWKCGEKRNRIFLETFPHSPHSGGGWLGEEKSSWFIYIIPVGAGKHCFQAWILLLGDLLGEESENLFHQWLWKCSTEPLETTGGRG